MTMTLQEISDRIEINDLIVRYSGALDRREWDLWESLFAPEAVVDYTEAGGIRGDVAEARRWLEETMPMFPAYQHLVANSEVTLTGDTASGRTMLFNPMGFASPKGGVRVAFIGLWYHDEFVRTDAGWRFSSRYEELSWRHNFPGDR
jgi:hypothetical protein